MAYEERTSNMGTKHDREENGATAATHPRVAMLREELARKHQEMDDLLLRSETLHPSAYAALQGQMEEELEQLQAELESLTTVAG